MNDTANFIDVGTVAQALKHQLRSAKRWDDLAPAAKEALDQIATLMARIASGDQPHWDAIMSYAQAAKPATAELERDIRRLVREIPRNSDV